MYSDLKFDIYDWIDSKKFSNGIELIVTSSNPMSRLKSSSLHGSIPQRATQALTTWLMSTGAHMPWLQFT